METNLESVHKTIDKIVCSSEAVSKVVGDIANISATSKQTMAASEETAAISQNHINQPQKAKNLVNELISSSDGLKKYFEEEPRVWRHFSTIPT